MYTGKAWISKCIICNSISLERWSFTLQNGVPSDLETIAYKVPMQQKLHTLRDSTFKHHIMVTHCQKCAIELVTQNDFCHGKSQKKPLCADKSLMTLNGDKSWSASKIKLKVNEMPL